ATLQIRTRDAGSIPDRNQSDVKRHAAGMVGTSCLLRLLTRREAAFGVNPTDLRRARGADRDLEQARARFQVLRVAEDPGHSADVRSGNDVRRTLAAVP